MDKVYLYLRYVSITIKSEMEYRYSFFTHLFVQIFTYSINYLGIWIIFKKFNVLNGWSYYEVIFLYNINLFTYGLCALFVWAPMRQVGEMVQQGTFDSILIRPLNPFFHMLSRYFTYGFLGHLILSTVVFIICFENLAITWTIAKIVWFIIFILGAFLIQCAMFIIGGSLSFWFVNSSSLVDTFIYGIRRFLDYPISIYNFPIKILLTFIVPYAFVNYYPATYFLNKSNEGPFNPIIQYGTPFVGIIMILLAYQLWCLGIKRYQSTGS